MRRRLLAALGASIVLAGAVVSAAASTAPATGRGEVRIEADPAREQAEEAVEDLRKAAAHTSARNAAQPVTSAPAAGWAAEKLWNATADDWEPAIAADSSSDWVYQATTRYGGAKACQQCPDPAIIVRASSDGGLTWGADRFICACRNTKAQNDPQLAVATNGTIYAAWLNDYNPGVVFSRSADRGVTWSPPISVKGKGLSFSDKPILAISPTGQDVYIAWNASDSYVSTSHDAGATFVRVKTNADALYWFAEGGVVAPNGTVLFSESAENQNATGPVQLAVVRSANGGASWTTTVIDTSQQQPACTVPSCSADFFASQAGIGVDPAGKLMVVYTLNTVAGAPKDLYVRTSADGLSWSPPAEIGQNTGDAGFPVIEAAGANDFRIAWQDDRNGPTSWNTWYRRTTDGGASWSAAVRLSDATSGAAYKNPGGYQFPYGDYFDLDVTRSGSNVLIWSEGSNYVGPGGSWFTRGA